MQSRKIASLFFQCLNSYQQLLKKCAKKMAKIQQETAKCCQYVQKTQKKRFESKVLG